MTPTPSSGRAMLASADPAALQRGLDDARRRLALFSAALSLANVAAAALRQSVAEVEAILSESRSEDVQ